jgi:hypothetical protein
LAEDVSGEEGEDGLYDAEEQGSAEEGEDGLYAEEQDSAEEGEDGLYAEEQDSAEEGEDGLYTEEQDSAEDVGGEEGEGLNFLDGFDDYLFGSCSCPSYQPGRPSISLNEQSILWSSHAPGDSVNSRDASVLGKTELPARDDATLDDFRRIEFGKAMFPSDDTRYLSLAASEVREPEKMEVWRRFDVDSGILELTSLAAIKSGFDVNYYPIYHSSVRETVRFPVRGSRPIHRMKNVVFGEPTYGLKNTKVSLVGLSACLQRRLRAKRSTYSSPICRSAAPPRSST